MNLQPSVTVMSELVTKLEDARWTVWDGVAPPDITPPFVSVYQLFGRQTAGSGGGECWGRLDPVWQLSCFGATDQQAWWLVGEVLAKDWAGWRPEPEDFTRLADLSAVPPWVQVTVRLRRFEVA